MTGFRRQSVQWDFLRFLAVGGGFSLGYSAVAAFMVGPMGLPPYWTSLALFMSCVPLAYLAHKYFSFGAKSARKGGFVIYSASQISSFALVSALTTRFVTGVYLLDTGIYICTVGGAAVLTFLVAKTFVFRASDAATQGNEASGQKKR